MRHRMFHSRRPRILKIRFKSWRKSWKKRKKPEKLSKNWRKNVKKRAKSFSSSIKSWKISSKPSRRISRNKNRSPYKGEIIKLLLSKLKLRSCLGRMWHRRKRGSRSYKIKMSKNPLAISHLTNLGSSWNNENSRLKISPRWRSL